MVTPEEAAREANLAVGQLLRSSPRWRAALGTGVLQTPILIERIDVNEPYYIVPFGREGRETARLLIDATSGEFEEVNAIEKPGEVLPVFLVPAVAPGPGRLPQMVWQPCRESSSPFLPFYRTSNGAYFRVDGATFDTLTDAPA